MSNPVISVIVVTHNHERFIGSALESVLNQRTTVPVEILVSEDASQDRTREIVSNAASHNASIQLMLSERNLNSNEVTYRAIRASRGRYVAVMDGDDCWISPEKLERQRQFLESHPASSVCFHDVRVIDENGATLEATRLGNRVEAFTGLSDVLAGNYVPGSAPMFRRETVAAMPDWLANAPYADWALLIAAARHGNVGYLPEPLGAYRVHGRGSWSGLDERTKAENVLAFYDSIERSIW